jgi:hypothetical protein
LTTVDEEPYNVDEPQNKRQGRPNLYTIVEDIG